jgi:predicted Fe-S protein YdhL (DUF1289 family)
MAVERASGLGPDAPGDAPWPADREVPSPCVDVCRMDPQGRFCEGCLRTIDEIADWGALGRADQLTIWARLRGRRQRQDP